MTFEIPTTRQEMYDTLQEIFHYYRIDREGFAGATLEELQLERMEFSAKSDEQLLEQAKTLLAGKHEREIIDYKNSIINQISGLNKKIDTLNSELEKVILEVESDFSQSESKIYKQLQANGLSATSIFVDKLAQLETSKNTKISEIRVEFSQKISDISQQIEQLNAKIEGADEYFLEIHALECTAKAEELKLEQEETERTVFKYNNSLDEKELKYRNSMTKTAVELKLKFMEISSGEFTKDELIKMGYYDDVLDCVTGYYNSLEPLKAFQDISVEERLVVYLEDYYQNLIYMYKMRVPD